jgi:hypothetical protein
MRYTRFERADDVTTLHPNEVEIPRRRIARVGGERADKALVVPTIPRGSRTGSCQLLTGDS